MMDLDHLDAADAATAVEGRRHHLPHPPGPSLRVDETAVAHAAYAGTWSPTAAGGRCRSSRRVLQTSYHRAGVRGARLRPSRARGRLPSADDRGYLRGGFCLYLKYVRDADRL